MKIILNERQEWLLIKLMEADVAPDFEDGDVKEFGDSSENGISSTIHDNNGDPKYGKMPIGDKIANTFTPQSYWANGISGRRSV